MFLHRCQHTQVALNSPGVVLADVAHNHLHKFLLAGKTPAIIEFPFQEAPETLYRAIVNTVCHTGHICIMPACTSFWWNARLVLVTSVTVEQRMCIWVALNGLVKGLEHKRIVIVLTQRIRHNTPVIEVQNSTQIELMYLNALVQFEFRHISELLLIGLISVKLAAQQVFSKILRIFGLPGTNVVMDADRTAQSCELIRECAKRHQVIFLTCKDDYSDKHGGNEIKM